MLLGLKGALESRNRSEMEAAAVAAAAAAATGEDKKLSAAAELVVATLSSFQ